MVQLDPGEYPFQQTRDRACDVAFRVTPDGTVDFDAEHDHLLGGRGTSTLHVVGVPVTLNPTGSPRPCCRCGVAATSRSAPREQTVRMPPGTAYESVSGPAQHRARFSVAADGRVDYPASTTAPLSGRGTGCLTVDLDTLGSSLNPPRPQAPPGRPARRPP